MSIKSNDLKKGAVVKLKNGWLATIQDNLKGNTRMAQALLDNGTIQLPRQGDTY